MSKLHPSQIYQDFWGENLGISIFKVLEVIPMRDLETMVNLDSGLVSLRHISNKLSGALFCYSGHFIEQEATCPAIPHS